MSDRPLVYPMKPKSAKWLRPGQFWALPLSDGTFGCGRVIEVPPPTHRINSMCFLAGVLDWHDAEVPTSGSIAGARCLAQGEAHIWAITRTGGTVLGLRDLVADGIKPWLFRGAEYNRNSSVLMGCIPLRQQAPEDIELPVLATWGYRFAVRVIEERFGIASNIKY